MILRKSPKALMNEFGMSASTYHRYCNELQAQEKAGVVNKKVWSDAEYKKMKEIISTVFVYC